MNEEENTRPQSYSEDSYDKFLKEVDLFSFL